MAFAAKRFFKGALSATLTTTLYTNPGGVTSIIKDIEITNTGTVTRFVTMALGASGVANQIFSGFGIAAGESVQWNGHQLVLTTELITGGQSVGTDVTVIIAGVEG